MEKFKFGDRVSYKFNNGTVLEGEITRVGKDDVLTFKPDKWKGTMTLKSSMTTSICVTVRDVTGQERVKIREIADAYSSSK